MLPYREAELGPLWSTLEALPNLASLALGWVFPEGEPPALIGEDIADLLDAAQVGPAAPVQRSLTCVVTAWFVGLCVCAARSTISLGQLLPILPIPWKPALHTCTSQHCEAVPRSAPTSHLHQMELLCWRRLVAQTACSHGHMQH